MLGFTLSEWLRATVGAVLFLAVGYVLTVTYLVGFGE